MRHLLLTTIAAVLVVGIAFADPIHDVAWKGDLAGVQRELNKGADVNARGFLGSTPLHNTARWGHKKVVEMLIAKDADVNARKKNGYTPLDEANWRNKPEIADLLREHGGKDGRRIEGTDASLGAAWAVCVQLCCGGREGLRGSGFV